MFIFKMEEEPEAQGEHACPSDLSSDQTGEPQKF